MMTTLTAQLQRIWTAIATLQEKIVAMTQTQGTFQNDIQVLANRTDNDAELIKALSRRVQNLEARLTAYQEQRLGMH